MKKRLTNDTSSASAGAPSERPGPDTAGTGDRKLVYILNYAGSDDTQHYVHVFNLLAALKELGWSIVVLSEKGGVGRATIFGQEVRYMSENGGLVRLWATFRELLSLQRKGYRLVFVRISRPAALVALAAGLIGRSRLLYWLSSANQDLDRKKSFLSRLSVTLQLGAIIRGCARFVTAPETMARYATDVIGVPDSKVLLLYNDIDLKRFSVVDRKPAEDGPVHILFVHSLSPNKEASRYFAALMRALNALRRKGAKPELTIVGEGPEKRLLETMARDAGQADVVHFLGGVPNQEIMSHYERADIFIMPSYREGMPRVILEAMASGLPIVATDAGGTRDLLGSMQQDFIVPRDDPVVFAERLCRLVEDSDARARLTGENLKRISRYSTETVARMYDRELSALLGRHAEPGTGA